MKLLAQYMSGRASKVGQTRQICLHALGYLRARCQNSGHTMRHCLQTNVMSTLTEWLGDAACNRNPMVLLIAGSIYLQEGDYGEALKVCQGDHNVEL